MGEHHKLCSSYLAAMEVLAKPWNGMLIAVLESSPLRYCELSAQLPEIGDRMLAVRLRELEQRGIVRRSVDPGPPVRVSYALTDVGRGFREVAEAISRWGRLVAASRMRAASGSTHATRSQRLRPAPEFLPRSRKPRP